MMRLIRGLIRRIKKLGQRYRKLLLGVFLVWGFFFLGLGAFIGSFFNKVFLDRFPDLNKEDKILIIAPHIDDEIIGSAGIIQKAIKIGAKVKIIYITNGDDTLVSVVAEEKNLRINGGDFVTLGEERMKEGKNATKLLGLKENDLYFLGYPDNGIGQLLNNYYGNDKKYPAPGTKFTYNLYSGTYREKQDYNGENLFNDLTQIINEYKANIMIIPHFADIHPDHKATYRFIDKYLTENNINNINVWLYLVHYKNYPVDKMMSLNRFLYPPQRLFGKGGWYSSDLDSSEVDIKLKAINENKSQILKIPGMGLPRFVRRNEIFEIHEL